ncbi:MAG: hypothetical protein KDN22_04805 [Verrucomicrobiae bacterium]|nr:hypothetical protein [Verrucomicrobiae bacterium]
MQSFPQQIRLRFLVALAALGTAFALSSCGTFETPPRIPPPPGSDDISNQAWSGAGRDASWEGGTPFGMPNSL